MRETEGPPSHTKIPPVHRAITRSVATAGKHHGNRKEAIMKRPLVRHYILTRKSLNGISRQGSENLESNRPLTKS